MFLAGPKVKKPLASKLASVFRPFDPGIKHILYYYTKNLPDISIDFQKKL